MNKKIQIKKKTTLKIIILKFLTMIMNKVMRYFILITSKNNPDKISILYT